MDTMCPAKNALGVWMELKDFSLSNLFLAIFSKTTQYAIVVKD